MHPYGNNDQLEKSRHFDINIAILQLPMHQLIHTSRRSCQKDILIQLGIKKRLFNNHRKELGSCGVYMFSNKLLFNKLEILLNLMYLSSLLYFYAKDALVREEEDEAKKKLRIDRKTAIRSVICK